MIACPSPEALQDLLRGTLSDLEAAPLRDHLGGCTTCLEELDRLSDDPELAHWLADGVAEVTAESTREMVLGRVRAARDAALTAGGRGLDLGPPDRDGDLGRLGPYHVEAVLGRGGMGVVLRAFDEPLQRLVALKVNQVDSLDEKARARFVREARAAAKVEHDHIVRIYAVASPSDGPPYLAMEYLDGSTLCDMIRIQGRIAPRDAARIVAEVAGGLAAAHAAGLIHRDVKPSNILFDKATGRAKIVDFGLARTTTRPIVETQEGTISGTPAFMSPEQARGQDDLDGRTDLYSLGVTLYEALTGELPFRGTTPMVLRQVLDDEPKAPRRLNDTIPRDLETVCLKAMAKEPSGRYPGAAEFADDLRRWLAGSPIQARPIGPVGRAWRVARRHPYVTALILALVLAMAGGTAGVVWQWRRAEANAAEANGYLRKSLGSIDDYFVKISENKLLDVPNLQPLRNELLLSARDYYEGLLRDRPDDPTIRTELAKARSSLATVVSLVGSKDEAIALFQQSLAEFDQIIAASPKDLSARHDRLACLIKLGKVQVISSRIDDAQVTFRRILDEAEPLRRQRPDDLEPIQATYSAHHGLGSVAYYRGVDPDRMIAEYEQALADNRLLLDRFPDQPAYLRNLSRTAGMLTIIYRAKGRPADADAVFDQSYQTSRRLVAGHPESQDYRFALASLERTKGTIPLVESLVLIGPAATAKLDQARECFRRGLAIDRQLIRENPRLDAYRSDLISILIMSSIVESGSGRTAEGLVLLREADEVGLSTDRPGGEMSGLGLDRINVLTLMAYAQSEEGRIDEALELLDRANVLFASMTPAERSVSTGSGPRDYFVAYARASILWDAATSEAAVPAWDRALELAPAAARPLTEFLREVRRAEVSLGPTPDPGRALVASRIIDADRTDPPLPGCSLVAYAKIYALASTAAPDPAARGSLAAKAVFCFEKAREIGFFRKIGRIEQVEADPTFATLEGQADYQAFRDACRGQVR